eukprot:9475259-Pyramimonas_sp.AAC.1
MEFGPEIDGPIAVIKEPLAMGVVTAAQGKYIYAQTFCKVVVRDRQRGQGRTLQLTGRLANLKHAYDVAWSMIYANGPPPSPYWADVPALGDWSIECATSTHANCEGRAPVPLSANGCGCASNDVGDHDEEEGEEGGEERGPRM